MKSEFKDIAMMQESIDAILGIINGKTILHEPLSPADYKVYHRRLIALDKFSEELERSVQDMADALSRVQLAQELV